MSIAPVSAAPSGVSAVTDRIGQLTTRMGGPTPGLFAAALTAAAPTAALGTSSVAPALSAASRPGQGLTGTGSLTGAVTAALGGPAALRPAALVAASTGTSPKATAAIEEAKKYLGTMYHWGGEDPSTGFDCSGLLQWAYGKQGVAIPRTTYDQVNAGQAVPVTKAALRPGDLLFTNYSARGPEHVVMYLGDGKVIEAAKRGTPVRIRDIDLSTVKEARRMVPAPTAGPATAGAAASAAAAVPGGSGPGWVRALPANAAPYVAQINAAAAAEGIDPAMVAAIVWNESNFNPSARSAVGAIGLGQLMPATAAQLGVNPHQPADNIRGTAKYLARQLRDFGSLELAAAAYNAGPGAVRKYGGVPPYAETQAYAAKVTATYEKLRGAR